MPNEPISESDRPSEKMKKVVGQFLTVYGLDTSSGGRLQELLKVSGEVEDMQGREV
jgi:hypothetical protein